MNYSPPPPDITPDQGDLIAQLGPLMLGSRLKRLGEQMQSGVADELARRGFPVQPAHTPTLVALFHHGPMTIGAISSLIGVRQPGVTRALTRLETLGLVESADSTDDRRQRPMQLTQAGHNLVQRLTTEFFPAIENVARQLCNAASGDLLASITDIESALKQRPMGQRISEEEGSASS